MVGVKYEGSWFLSSASARYLKSGVFSIDWGLHIGIACNMKVFLGALKLDNLMQEVCWIWAWKVKECI